MTRAWIATPGRAAPAGARGGMPDVCGIRRAGCAMPGVRVRRQAGRQQALYSGVDR